MCQIHCGLPGAEEEVPRVPRVECIGLSQGNCRREGWGGWGWESSGAPRTVPFIICQRKGRRHWQAEQASLAALPPTTVTRVCEGREGESTVAPVGGEAVRVEGQRAEMTHTLPRRQAGEAGNRWGKVYCYRNEGFA